MKKLFGKIKENNEKIDKVDYKEISKNIKFKTIFFTILISLIIALPNVLIFVELFKQFPPVVWVYYLIAILAIITILVFISLCNLIYYNLLKNYVEKEEVQKIDLKYVFLGELLNPIYLIVLVVSFAILTYFIK